jgi:hypothetical protein
MLEYELSNTQLPQDTGLLGSHYMDLQEVRRISERMPGGDRGAETGGQTAARGV